MNSKYPSENLMHFLLDRGAGNSVHSGRHLLDHLLGTWRLLESWGCDSDTRLGGLFHSIYGTSYFRTRTVDISDREDIKVLIGEGAENLAFLFSVINRPNCFFTDYRTGHIKINRGGGSLLKVGQEICGKLLEIEIANLVEQNAGDNFLREIARRQILESPHFKNSIRQNLNKSIGFVFS